jgi:hypothetical protein
MCISDKCVNCTRVQQAMIVTSTPPIPCVVLITSWIETSVKDSSLWHTCAGPTRLQHTCWLSSMCGCVFCMQVIVIAGTVCGIPVLVQPRYDNVCNGNMQVSYECSHQSLHVTPPVPCALLSWVATENSMQATVCGRTAAVRMCHPPPPVFMQFCPKLCQTAVCIKGMSIPSACDHCIHTCPLCNFPPNCKWVQFASISLWHTCAGLVTCMMETLVVCVWAFYASACHYITAHPCAICSSWTAPPAITSNFVLSSCLAWHSQSKCWSVQFIDTLYKVTSVWQQTTYPVADRSCVSLCGCDGMQRCAMCLKLMCAEARSKPQFSLDAIQLNSPTSNFLLSSCLAVRANA